LDEMQAFAGYWKHFAIYQRTYMLYFHYSEWKDESQDGLICCNCQKSRWL